MSRDRYSSPPKTTGSFNARAKSPLLYNETSTDEGSLYQIAMKKVYEASWRFDRGKNGDFLKVYLPLLFLNFIVFTALTPPVDA
jgi:hypothetical protein